MFSVANARDEVNAYSAREAIFARDFYVFNDGAIHVACEARIPTDARAAGLAVESMPVPPVPEP